MCQTSVSGSSHTVSGVWKIAPRFSSDEGIAVNSWNVPVKINNARASLCVSRAFPLLTLRFNPLTGAFMHKTVAAEQRGGVNQSNVSWRLESVSSGPESAIFQLLSKNMCSRYSYRSPSKWAADRINHMSFIMALKKEAVCVRRSVAPGPCAEPQFVCQLGSCVHIWCQVAGVQNAISSSHLL